MIWKETGVCKGSYMCFFDPSRTFKEFYYYMISCGYFLCDNNYSVRYKGTRPPIFFYIISGALELNYEGSHYKAQANDVILMNCYKPQHYYCTDHCEFLFFHYDGKMAQALTDHLIRQNMGPVFSLANAQEIYHAVNTPIMKLCYQEQVSEPFLSSLVYQILCMVPVKNNALAVPPADHETISAKVIAYIDKNISHNFTLHELALQANLSPYYFSRLFKKETGHSPLEYVSIAKINYAKLMLQTTAVSISEVADFLGYSSPSSFINAFKARRGMSPSQYRKQVSCRYETSRS